MAVAFVITLNCATSGHVMESFGNNRPTLSETGKAILQTLPTNISSLRQNLPSIKDHSLNQSVKMNL